MDLKKRYIVDLSQAQNPADIVFELSNIIEKPEAANQKIWLKLGDINLNQSQILSIQSLISSINSTLSLIESQSQQTELAAATLGICTKDVEEEIEKELEENTPEAPLNTENDTPVQQYIPMTDHIDTEETKEDKEEISEENKVEIKEQEELNTESAKQESVNAEESNPSSSSDLQEKEIITPAIEEAYNEKKICCFGPYAADGFFGNGSYTKFDGVLAMYHDQGLAPFKTLDMDSGVNFTAGLPFVRTSPDHGTGYDIAGKGVASPASMLAAIYAAIDIYRNRTTYAEIHANPLRKQYFDKSNDNVVLDLSKDDDDDEATTAVVNV